MERRSALRDLARGFTEGNEGNEDPQIVVDRLVSFVTFCSKFRRVGLNGMAGEIMERRSALRTESISLGV